METRFFLTQNNRETKSGNELNDSKPGKYQLWLKKVKEISEQNRAYLNRIHPTSEAICA